MIRAHTNARIFPIVVAEAFFGKNPAIRDLMSTAVVAGPPNALLF